MSPPPASRSAVSRGGRSCAGARRRAATGAVLAVGAAAAAAAGARRQVSALSRSRRCPTACRWSSCSHHEQPAVSMRLLVRAGARADPADKPGVAHARRRRCSIRARRRSRRRRSTTRSTSSAARWAPAPAPTLTYLNMVVMKDSFDAASDAVADMARQPAFAQDEIERQRQQIAVGAAGQLRRSRVHRQRRVRSAGLRLPSVRHAADRHARRRSPRSRATICSRSTRRFRPQQRDPRASSAT